MILKIVDDTSRVEDFDFDNIFLDEKLFENYSHKTLIGSKPFSVMLNKIAALIRDNDETKYYY